VSVKSKKALVTCETTAEFLEQLRNRGIQVNHDGWGKTGMSLDKKSLIVALQNCEIAFVELEHIDVEVIENCPDLRFIGVARGAPTNVDLNICSIRGITVATTPARNADAVADYSLAMMIVATRSIFSSALHLKDEGWNYQGQLPYLKFRGREIGSLKVGLYGLGNIGLKVAKRLHYGFGTDVLFYDPFVNHCLEARKVDSLDELFSESDMVSLHAPVNDSTKRSISGNLLDKLGPNGLLINAARAGLIDEDLLFNYLEQGKIAGAVLDVYWHEPLDVKSKWLNLENVICTPHIAGATFDVIDNHCQKLILDFDKWLST